MEEWSRQVVKEIREGDLTNVQIKFWLRLWVITPGKCSEASDDGILHRVLQLDSREWIA